MTIPHIPFNFSMADIPRATTPTRPNSAGPVCAGCINKTGEIAAKNVRINDLAAEAATLREQITDLQAHVNALPPTERDFEDLRKRTHLLAKQDAEARAALADVRNELQTALGKLASTERTVANLHARFKRLGLTP